MNAKIMADNGWQHFTILHDVSFTNVTSFTFPSSEICWFGLHMKFITQHLSSIVTGRHGTNNFSDFFLAG